MPSWIRSSKMYRLHDWSSQATPLVQPVNQFLSVQLELTEFPDVRRIDTETLQELTEPIVAHCISLNLATAAALGNVVPAKISFWISGVSIVLSLFLFIHNFILFHRQAGALCCTPRCFFKNKCGQFVHVTEDVHPNSDSLFPIITLEEYTTRAPAKEALWKTEAKALFARSARDEEKTYTDFTEASVQHLRWFWLPSL